MTVNVAVSVRGARVDDMVNNVGLGYLWVDGSHSGELLRKSLLPESERFSVSQVLTLPE